MAVTNTSIEDLMNPDAKKKFKEKTASSKKLPKRTKIDEERGPIERLNVKLTEMDQADEEAKARTKAVEYNLPYIDLTIFPVSAEALKLIDLEKSKKERVVCFVNTGEQLRFATTNPTNPEVEKLKHALGEAHHAETATYFVSERSINKTLEYYEKQPKYTKPVVGVEIKAEEMEKFAEIASDFKKLNEIVKKTNITEMVTLIIAASIKAESSDIHIEAEEKDIKIRFRVDGVLHDTAEIDKNTWPKVISRIKLLSGLKINVVNVPQDGRFTIHLKDETIDVRVSCLPTTWGESVVFRLLKSSSASLSFEDLGLIGEAYKNLKSQIERPNGMIITTGPTGSGKTTTLYAVLNKLNTENTKIITLEDPVEYKLKGINQSQVDHSKGYSFAEGLRSLLRQDPDIVMVGEMRDTETSEVGINAALTGHLVLSTIHTNNAAGAIPRFLSMNVKPFLLAPALNAIIGQRLIRKICSKCKTEDTLTPEKEAQIKKIIESIPTNHPDRPKVTEFKLFKGTGCDHCHGIGYKGRIGIYEIMSMSPEIEKSIMEGNISEMRVQELATNAGMLTMLQDGLLKVLNGTTTLDEVLRVTE
ncbi:MAG: GspE/PulE family protein [Patescibacteria group bacterium]